MEYMQGPGGFYIDDDTAVTLGKFDGLHLGHQKLVSRIRELEKRNCKSVVFTLNPMEKGQILTDEERRRMAAKLGVDYLLDCPLTPEITHMGAEEFIEDILVRGLHARYLVVGCDFRFGYQRSGDFRLLQELQHRYGYTVEVLKKEQYHGRDISSTYIREELAAGHMETVGELLGYPFFVSGEVLHGQEPASGSRLSTVSLAASTRKLLPPEGVYITRTIIGKVSFPGITNVGGSEKGRKSFRGVETYLFDFDRELLGETIEIQFLKWMRPEKSFSAREALHRQIDADISSGKEYFGE